MLTFDVQNTLLTNLNSELSAVTSISLAACEDFLHGGVLFRHFDGSFS